jgi:hypothetical protein
MTEPATDGFVRIPNTLIDHSDMDIYEMVVYTVLLRYRNPKTGKCWPGLSTIADGARCSRKTVIRTIAKLEARGAIKVKRGAKNESNVYEVALFDEMNRMWWASSAKGSRRPHRELTDETRARMSAAARRARDSESLVAEVVDRARDSESPPRDSESPPLGTPSPPKKTKKNKTNEITVRSDLPIAPHVSFEVVEDRATDKQTALLSDLWIHITSTVPTDDQRSKWADLTVTGAADLIGKYYANVDGRIGNYDGPESGTPAYMALTPTGKLWADTGMDPATARETAAA